MSDPAPTLVRFTARLETEPGDQNTFFVIPAEVRKALGARGRLPVCGEINGCAFRGSLHPYGGVHYLGVSKALRREAQVEAGDTVEITLEVDRGLRQVTPPPDLAAALQAQPGAAAAWERLSYTHKKEIVRSLDEARRLETRRRRLEQAVQALAGQGASGPTP